MYEHDPHQARGRVQYVDVRAERGQSLQKLVRIESTELLDRLLESCAPGLKFVDIMVLILSAPGVTRLRRTTT